MDRPSSWRYTDLDLLLLRPCSSMSYQLYLEQFVLSNAQLILTGDLNLKLKDPTHPESETFAMITEQFGLTQHVAEPTHKLGGWLDVIVTRDDCQVTDVTVHPPILSDHGLVMACIPFIYESSLLTTRRIRHWKKLDRAAFRSALQAEPLFYRDREREYREAIIVKQSKDPKKLWTTFNGLLGRRPANQHLQSSPHSKRTLFWFKFKLFYSV